MPALLRRNLRPLLAAAVAAVLVLGVAAPVHSQESEEATGTGSSALTVVPATLDVDGLPEEVRTAVGTLLSEATNADVPVARLALDGLTAAGERSPTLDVSSADGDRTGDESRQVGAGGVSAAVSLVDYAVASGADTATAHLSALDADLATPLGLGVDVDAQQVATTAEPTRSAGAVLLTLTGLELGLGDLLPAEVLEALPLSVVLDLAGSLDLPLPTTLTDQIGDLDELQGTLQDAVEAATDLDGLETQLATAIADDPTLSALEDDVDALEAEVASLETEIATLEDEIDTLETQIAALETELADLDSVTDTTEILGLEDELANLESELSDAETELTSAESDLADAESDLADAEAALADALDDLASLDPAIADLLTQIEELENLLDDLLLTLDDLLEGFDPAQLRLDLLDALTGTPLVDLGALTLDLGTVANATGSEGRVSCETSDLQVLGDAVPAPTCEDISAAISGLGDTIGDALATLPVTAPVPEVTIGGLTPTASGLQAPNADGRSSASAGVTALSVDIGSVDLTGTVDDLVAELEALVAELEALVDDLDLTDGLAGTVSPASTGPEASAVQLPAGLGDVLAELEAALDTLPLGDGLDGLSTLGIGATLGTVDLTSSFVPAEPTAVPRDPSTPTATPESPESPTGAPEMPRTGGESHLLFMAALAAVAAGAVTMGLGRTVELGLHRAGTRRPR